MPAARPRRSRTREGVLRRQRDRPEGLRALRRGAARRGQGHRRRSRSPTQLIAAQRRRSGRPREEGPRADPAREERGRPRRAAQGGAARRRRARRITCALGIALHKLGKIDEAALEFRAALKRAPDDAEAHVLLGMALRDQNELDEAQPATSTRRSSSTRATAARTSSSACSTTGRRSRPRPRPRCPRPCSCRRTSRCSGTRTARSTGCRSASTRRSTRTARRSSSTRRTPRRSRKLGAAARRAQAVRRGRGVPDPGDPRASQEQRGQLPPPRRGLRGARRRTGSRSRTYQKFLELAPKNDPDRDRARDAINELKRR